MRYWARRVSRSCAGSRRCARDDTLTVSLTVLDSRPSAKDRGRGTVLLQWEAVNQDGVVALRMSGRGLFGRRTPAG